MSAVASIRKAKPDALERLMGQVLVEVRELRREVAELRRAPSAPALVDSLRQAFASGKFTAATALAMAERDARLWDALIDAGVDLEAPAASIGLGMLFARMPELERIARGRCGGIYRVRN